jgi:hypothetical protein
MSRLNFAPLAEAFYLGSDKIKDTQEEINKLRKIINGGGPGGPGGPGEGEYSSSTLSKSKLSNSKDETNESSILEKNEKPPPLNLSYSNKTADKASDADYLKVMQDPNFDQIVKNYIIIKHPDWVNSSFKENNKNDKNDIKSKSSSSFIKEGFGGESYSTTVCSNIKNYIIFFVITLLIYLWLSNKFK